MLYTPKYTTAQPVKSFTPVRALKGTHKKDKAFTNEYTLMHIKDSEVCVFANLRIYRPNPQGNVYACFWGSKLDVSGSACVDYMHDTYLAIESAGYTFINERHLAHSPESYLLGIAAFHGLEGACVLHSHA